MKYEYMTMEARDEGYNTVIVVHGWSTYPQNSVLAGQSMKCFVDTFETEDEAKAAYPEAEMSHEFMQPQNTFDHLSDNDYDW